VSLKKYTVSPTPVSRISSYCFYGTLRPLNLTKVDMETTVTYALWTGLSSKGQSMVNKYRVSQGLESYVLDDSRWSKKKRKPNSTTKKGYFKNS
jgi:multidrug transporter EmrE-like cation transporter